MFSRLQFLVSYGEEDVETFYPLALPGTTTIRDVQQIRELLANEIKENLRWFAFLRDMFQFHIMLYRLRWWPCS